MFAMLSLNVLVLRLGIAITGFAGNLRTSCVTFIDSSDVLGIHVSLPNMKFIPNSCGAGGISAEAPCWSDSGACSAATGGGVSLFPGRLFASGGGRIWAFTAGFLCCFLGSEETCFLLAGESLRSEVRVSFWKIRSTSRLRSLSAILVSYLSGQGEVR